MNGARTRAYLKELCSVLDGVVTPRALRRAALTLALPVAGLSLTGVSLGQDQPMYGVPFERTCPEVLTDAVREGSGVDRCDSDVLACRCQLIREGVEVDSCGQRVCGELLQCLTSGGTHDSCGEQACAQFDRCANPEPQHEPPPQHPEERTVRNAGCQGG